MYFLLDWNEIILRSLKLSMLGLYLRILLRLHFQTLSFWSDCWRMVYKCIYRLIELGFMLSGIDPLSFISKGGANILGGFWPERDELCTRDLQRHACETTMTFVKYVKL